MSLKKSIFTCCTAQVLMKELLFNHRGQIRETNILKKNIQMDSGSKAHWHTSNHGSSGMHHFNAYYTSSLNLSVSCLSYLGDLLLGVED